MLGYRRIQKNSRINFEVADIFRGITISDTKEINLKDLNLYKKCDYTLGDEKYHNLPIFRECINSYVSTEFLITLDTNITKLLNIDIDYIMSALNDYSKFWHNLVSPFEKYADKFSLYFPNEDEDYNANFCIGGGAGFLTKTITYAMFDDKNEALKTIREFLDASFMTFNRKTRQKEPAHKHKLKDTLISPRTLKLANDNNDFVNLGWCNISVAE